MSDMSVQVLGETTGVIRISIDGQDLYLPRHQAGEFLSVFMAAMADSIPEPANWSRRVPDTPGLRLVGGFQCDPDESCGAA